MFNNHDKVGIYTTSKFIERIDKAIRQSNLKLLEGVEEEIKKIEKTWKEHNDKGIIFFKEVFAYNQALTDLKTIITKAKEG